LAKKWTDRLAELRKRLQDLLHDLAGGSPPEPALAPVRVKVHRP